MKLPIEEHSFLKLNNISIDLINTPAFVYDEQRLIEAVASTKEITNQLDVKLLFSLKASAIVDALCLIAPMLDGFASSSLFEATLARDIIQHDGTIHITTPSLKYDEIDNLAEICDYISFNSVAQCKRLRDIVGNRAYCGLRINPQLSFVKDDRYNPCRKYSKLGVPINILTALIDNDDEIANQIDGIHFHTNCESESLIPLLDTVRHIDKYLGKILKRIQWINLGGGYQYNQIKSFEPLYEAVRLLRQKYGLTVFIEPGEAIVGHSGYLISTVVDLFDSDSKSVAILDTSINHMPQVFEYQYCPDISNSILSGKYSYILCGASCLAGDIFGSFSFDVPLEIGSKVVFEHMGAYTLVKANMFNGINLPYIYALNKKRELILKKKFTYDDYVSKWGNKTE